MPQKGVGESARRVVALQVVITQICKWLNEPFWSRDAHEGFIDWGGERPNFQSSLAYRALT